MGHVPAAADEEGHIPVLYQAVLTALNPKPGGHYIDCTLGAAGHAAGILERSAPDGLLLGLDRDPRAISIAQQRLADYGERAILQQRSFTDLDLALQAIGWRTVQGILFDLGLSSMQIDSPERGFSFRYEAPLDMRADPNQALTAEQVVNQWPQSELADVLARFGEERAAKRIAQTIVDHRPIHTTLELAELVERAVGRRRGRIHPATKTFQALRIAVNHELDNLEIGLEKAIHNLAPGGRLAVISFHSLEDRIVKHTLRRESQDCICPPEQPVCTCEHEARLKLVSRRSIRADEDEIEANPRARSASLRVAERI
ncbi:MAG: 16S rRNA (cytosine(1402)-N(4))-methyltransferase RsmH [Anaerolineales bacterium]|jgi:16S rRNA (cytosine1402-N4)-methyltransferase